MHTLLHWWSRLPGPRAVRASESHRHHKKLFPRRCAVVSQMNMNNSLVRFLSLVKHKQSFSLSLSHSYAPPPQYDFRNSEAPSHTGVKQQGGRLKEASNINQSLPLSLTHTHLLHSETFVVVSRHLTRVWTNRGTG